MAARLKPGQVRDAITDFLRGLGPGDASVAEIQRAVTERLGREVPSSSVRSYLNKNTPASFARTSRGRYRLEGAE
ncbi:hypothetical protein E0L36_19875 [Streptomyces sp. AJS327]|uniref:hypothetical protein n=1 Tax=Streptomyces sp. AJS327 TaxID=2545265 RepID=UPI0015DF1F09|nr:hypothetical protein [Streptomyces sp. AJS327]MBA0053047.1 hypothetical protein [Streptomyces sp. AJS327]